MDLFQMVRRSDDIGDVLSAIDSADINLTNRNHQNLLHEAIARNKPDIAIELIRRQIDLDCQDHVGMTPLHYAACYQSAKIAKLILDHGGNPSIQDRHGNSALWYAVYEAKGEHYDLVKLLMNAGTDPFSKNLHGKSPYDFASQINDTKLLQLLATESGN